MIDKKPIILSEEKMGQEPEVTIKDYESADAPGNFIKPEVIIEIAPEIAKDGEGQLASTNVSGSNLYQSPDFPPGTIVEIAPEVVLEKQNAAGSGDPQINRPIIEIAPEIVLEKQNATGSGDPQINMPIIEIAPEIALETKNAADSGDPLD